MVSVRKALVKFINLQTIVEGGPWDIFVISKIRHFLFLNCDVMKNVLRIMIEMYSMKREGEKTYSEGSKLCTCTEMKRML